MERRKFLGIGLTSALLLPLGVLATDFRKTKPVTWTAKSVNDAIKALYGEVTLEESKEISLKIPKMTSNGMSVPVGIKSKIKAKTVALFQNSNPESAVSVWTVPENGIVDYNLKIKLKTIENEASVVTLVVEGEDGKFYVTDTSVTVAGGCEG